MLILNSKEVEQTLTVRESVEAMKEAFVAISTGSAQNPNRIHMNFPEVEGTTLVMPAYAKSDVDSALAIKIVSIFDRNLDVGLPRVLGAVLVLDTATGMPKALINGASLTAIRTAAATAVATELLSRREATTLGIIGAGVLARAHIMAICEVRDIENVLVSSRSRESADALVEEFNSIPDLNCSIQAVDNSNQVVEAADIICTVTSSSNPVFDAHCVRDGCHLNAIGSYQPDCAEIPGSTIAKSRLFVDQRTAALAEAGDIIRAIESGLIENSHVIGEIGEVIENRVAGRTSDNDVTVFKSVGNSVQDCICAQRIVEKALASEVGRSVDI